MARMALTPAWRARWSISFRSASNCESSRWAWESTRESSQVEIGAGSLTIGIPERFFDARSCKSGTRRHSAQNDNRSFEAGADGHFFEEAGQHRRAVRQRGGDDHAVGFDAAELARLEVAHHNDFAADELFRRVDGGYAGDDLADFVAEIHHHFEDLVRAGDFFGGFHLADAHFD